ncbi:MAG: hypothetical protein ACRCV0_07920 [Brevinema sp.]
MSNDSETFQPKFLEELIVKQNYKVISDHYDSFFSKSSASKYIEYLLDCVYAVELKIQEQKDIATIFEVVNDRGEKLRAHEILKANVNAQKNEETPPGFPHCNPNICAIDTATYDENVRRAIEIFRNKEIYLKNNSLYFSEKSEKANHLILKGLRAILR